MLFNKQLNGYCSSIVGEIAVKSPYKVLPSGPRRWLRAPVREVVDSNPTAVILPTYSLYQWP